MLSDIFLINSTTMHRLRLAMASLDHERARLGSHSTDMVDQATVGTSPASNELCYWTKLHPRTEFAILEAKMTSTAVCCTIPEPLPDNASIIGEHGRARPPGRTQFEQRGQLTYHCNHATVAVILHDRHVLLCVPLHTPR
jgi:hypothetical protein